MMPSRGLHSSNPLLYITKLKPLYTPIHHNKTFSRHVGITYRPQKHVPFTLSPLRVHYSSVKLPSSVSDAVRFSSTDSAAYSISNVEPVAVPTDEIATPFSFDDIIASDIPSVTPHIGYLKELGLDYGWGPTAFVETVLEYVHVYSGTAWGASILMTALALRLALFKGYINASDTNARMAVLMPHIEPLKDRLKDAQATQDTQEVLRTQQELKMLYQKFGIKLRYLALPFLNVPLGFGTYRLLTGMAALPVPGLDQAGFLWLQDLTVSDPFFILPLATGGAFYLTFKFGGETGAAITKGGMQFFLMYLAPSIMAFTMAFWPACFQLTLCCTSMLSLGQSFLLRNARVRNYLGIQPLPPKAPTNVAGSGKPVIHRPPSSSPSQPAKESSVIGGAVTDIKGAGLAFMKKVQSLRSQRKKKEARRSKDELKRAKDYDLRRRWEIESKQGDRRG